MKVYYLVYKLTNLVNGKIYIGCHMTKNLDDNYMGSGRRLGYAKKKYGIENFKKEILSTHETLEEMLTEEARLVNEEFLGRDDVYNLTLGGKGSWFCVNQSLTSEQRSKAGNAGGFVNMGSDQRSKFTKSGGLSKHRNLKNSHDEGKLYYQTQIKMMIDASRSDESIQKRKETFANINHQQGNKNSQFGTCWIFNDELKVSRKIKIEEKDEFIKSGWKPGRKIKF